MVSFGDTCEQTAELRGAVSKSHPWSMLKRYEEKCRIEKIGRDVDSGINVTEGGCIG